MSSDWYQDRRIRELNEALEAQSAAAARRQSALRARLEALQGDLATKVGALTDQLNAVIEIGDLREELTLYVPTRRARDAARDLSRALVHGDGDVTFLREQPALVADGEYWLVPAVLAVLEAREGRLDEGQARAALACDRLRAATYLVAMTTLLGHPELCADLLPDVFAAPEEQWRAAPTHTATTRRGEAPPVGEVTVSHAERAVWRAATAGMLGAQGPVVVQRAVAARLALVPEERWRTGDRALLAVPPAIGRTTGEAGAAGSDGEGDTGPRGRRGRGSATQIDEATLAAWAAWTRRAGSHVLDPDRGVGAIGSTAATTGAATTGAATTPGTDPWGTAPSAVESASPAAASTAPAGGTAAVHADLDRVVTSLLQEAGPRERDLVTRIQELGRRIGQAPDADATWWRTPADALLDAVLADARGTDPDAAHLVAALVAPHLRTAAEHHQRHVLDLPVPRSSVRLSTATVEITPDDDGEQAARQTVERYHAAVLPGPNWVGLGIAGAAALLFVVLAATSGYVVWWAFAAVALAIAGYTYLRGSQARIAERERRDLTVARFREQLAEARADVRRRAEELDVRREVLRRNQEALHAQLEKAPALL